MEPINRLEVYDENKIIYLIQPALVVGLNRYKVGCSEKRGISRCINGYKKGTRYLYIEYCENPREMESYIKAKFREKFRLVAGHEFFEGDEAEIYDTFTKAIDDFRIFKSQGGVYPTKIGKVHYFYKCHFCDISKELCTTCHYIKNNFPELLTDKKILKHFINYHLFKTELKIADTKVLFFTDNHMYSSIVKSNKPKIKLLLKLRDKLGITDGKEKDSITIDNYDDVIDINEEDMELIDKAFRTRRTNTNSYKRVVLVNSYMTKLKTLIGNCIVCKHKNVSFYKNKKRIRFSIPVWNHDHVKHFDIILEQNKQKTNIYRLSR